LYWVSSVFLEAKYEVPQHIYSRVTVQIIREFSKIFLPLL